MIRTLIYLSILVQVCAIFYLIRQRFLNREEKLAVFATTVLSLPIVRVLSEKVFFDVHDEAYNATATVFSEAIRSGDGGLNFASWVLSLAAPFGVLYLAGKVNNWRSQVYAARWQQMEEQRIEQRKLAKRAAEQLKLDTELALQKSQNQAVFLGSLVQQKLHDRQEGEADLLLAFANFRLRVDPDRERSIEQHREEFRAELGRRSIPKINLHELSSSENPEVQAILGAVRQLPLTP